MLRKAPCPAPIAVVGRDRDRRLRLEFQLELQPLGLRLELRAAGRSSGSKSLALIQGTKADNFYVTMGCGAKAEAPKLGYSINVQGPADFAAPEQIPIVNSITAQHPGAVLIAPTDTQALIAPMKQMSSAGIKLIQVDTTVNDKTIAAASISSDNIEGGAKAADALAKLIGSKGSVVVMNEQPGVSTTEQRIQGFIQEIKKYPNIKPLTTQYVGDNPAKAAQAITPLYAAHPDLSGVFATNVLVAQGVDTGLKTTGAAKQGEDRRLRRRPHPGLRPQEAASSRR